MLEWISSPEAWAALVTLTALEVVLGIDNIIFISILVDRLPKEQQKLGRTLGLAFAMLTRIALLFSLAWLAKLTAPLFTVLGEVISGRDLVLILGGLFLLAKATMEIHDNVEGHPEEEMKSKAKAVFWMVIVQIGVLDLVFSLDSVITAIGMARDIEVMVIAVMIAVFVMMIFAGSISDFINAHPSLKILALSFLIMIGVALIGEGLDMHIPKGYIYFSMAFSFGVEMLNMRRRRNLDHPRVAG